MELEFDVKIDGNILYDYMLHHTYSGFQGVLGTAVGGLMIVGFAATGYVIWLIGGIILLLYLPWSLFLKSRQQILRTPAFKEALHYHISEGGVEISQKEMKEFQSWDCMHKAVSTGKSIILYTSPVNACIFPRKDLGEKQTTLVKIISSSMPPGKVKIRGTRQ